MEAGNQNGIMPEPALLDGFSKKPVLSSLYLLNFPKGIIF